jgi:hypothetical protein
MRFEQMNCKGLHRHRQKSTASAPSWLCRHRRLRRHIVKLMLCLPEWPPLAAPEATAQQVDAHLQLGDAGLGDGRAAA